MCEGLPSKGFPTSFTTRFDRIASGSLAVSILGATRRSCSGASNATPDLRVCREEYAETRQPFSTIRPRRRAIFPSEPVSDPEGKIIRPGISVIGPSGRAPFPAGKLNGPDSSVIFPSGPVTRPAGKESGPGCRVIFPSGPVLGNSGPVIRPEGKMTGEQGRAIRELSALPRQPGALSQSRHAGAAHPPGFFQDRGQATSRAARAKAALSLSTSTGLTRCSRNPDSLLRLRSSSMPKPLTAMPLRP